MQNEPEPWDDDEPIYMLIEKLLVLAACLAGVVCCVAIAYLRQ